MSKLKTHLVTIVFLMAILFFIVGAVVYPISISILVCFGILWLVYQLTYDMVDDFFNN